MWMMRPIPRSTKTPFFVACRRSIAFLARRSHADNPRFTAALPDEMAHFNALASSWWDVDGPQRILHKMNLLRMDFIHENVSKYVQLNPPLLSDEEPVYIPPYGLDLLPKPIRQRIVADQDARRERIMTEHKYRVLDVGCGGGILSESMARLPFVESVRGIDLSSDVLNAAIHHRSKDPVFNDGKLQYDLLAIEDIDPAEKFDIITMFEMLEHVEYPSKVLKEALDRVSVGGWVFISTINRDLVSWFTTIFMGEHVLKIVPQGTHLLEKYIDHKEIRDWVLQTLGVKDQYEVVDAKGCMYLPACGWVYSPLPDVGNYFLAIRRTSDMALASIAEVDEVIVEDVEIEGIAKSTLLT